MCDAKEEGVECVPGAYEPCLEGLELELPWHGGTYRSDLRQPDRAELVTDAEPEQVAIEAQGTESLEPQGIVVGPEHSLELGLDGGPHLFGGFGNGLGLRHVR